MKLFLWFFTVLFCYLHFLIEATLVLVLALAPMITNNTNVASVKKLRCNPRDSKYSAI